MAEPLRVCIDARLISGDFGGVEQFILSLAHGLGQLDPGPEEYSFLMLPGHTAWLEPYLPPRAMIVETAPSEPPRPPSAARELAKRILPWAPRLLAARRARVAAAPPNSDGTVERGGFDLVHFTKQDAFTTDVPSIYHPHDLQHVHLPEFFTATEIQRRDLWYRTFCERASMVAAGTEWTRIDLLRHFGLPEKKVQVVNLAPFASACGEPLSTDFDKVKAKLSLPPAFILYPAQTWPHKNHLGLLEALALLNKESGLVVPLVCTGTMNGFYDVIRQRATALGLAPDVHFVGFVDPVELAVLYRTCVAVVVPTKFEAASGPVWEAFAAGAPVACSNVTSLPRQVGDAALVFDPDDYRQMARCIWDLWNDPALRERLVRLGRENVRRFTWRDTAHRFRAHYRRIAGRMTPDDAAVLAKPPLL